MEATKSRRAMEAAEPHRAMEAVEPLLLPSCQHREDGQRGRDHSQVNAPLLNPGLWRE
jgi:hypothetical protein